MRFLRVCGLAVWGLAFMGVPHHVRAQEEVKNPVFQAAEDFSKTFSEADKRHFYVLFGNYNVIKVVQTVEEDVGKAIAKCAEKNPDMKEAVETKFKAWQGAFEPIMQEATGHLDNMLFAQDYAKPEDIKVFFGKIDTARQSKDQGDKSYVGTKPACESLLKTMNKTQKDLTGLLRATLLTVPQTMESEGRPKAPAQKTPQDP